MSRNYTTNTVDLLQAALKIPGIALKELHKDLGKGQSYKDFYNAAYRLVDQEFLERKDNNKGPCVWITIEGKKLLGRLKPERDGIWKIVIFDIPEKHKYVRVVLRAKLKALHFKKWQNSIWISPFALDKEIEEELNELAKKFFVRLIKSKEINRIEDLEKMFQ